MTDSNLLQEYVDHHSEKAFAALVDRYVGLVYSAALRQVGNPPMAEEVTQATFIILARKAHRLRPQMTLSGWLYQTARFAARDALRGEQRRRQRESDVLRTESTMIEDNPWEEMVPLLDEAMARLGTKDRNAVLLRFFENKSLQEIGAALGVSSDSARMRVARALEKLRSLLKRRGVVLSSVALASLLTERTIEAAPAGLAHATAGAALFQNGAAAASAIALANGTLKLMLQTKIKLAAAAGIFCAMVAGAIILAAPLVSSGPPDARALLENIAAVRQSVVSGEMQFELAHTEFGRSLDGTNRSQLRVVFDHERRRWEQDQRSYHYVLQGPDAAALTDAKRTQLHLDREAAVKAGLLNSFNDHHVIAFDGEALLSNWQNDGRPVSANIDDPKKGSAWYAFDPRLLGLSGSLSPNEGIREALGVGSHPADSIILVGRDSVDSVNAWHVQAQWGKRDLDGRTLDFWIEVAHPARVLKLTASDHTVSVRSKFDPSNPKDPLPIQVTILRFHGLQQPDSETLFTRRAARYNIPVDPASWTLAGLGLMPGTEVVDLRKHRRIGYWSGHGLADAPPPGGVAPAGALVSTRNSRSPVQLLALAEEEPASPFALEAASWVLLNTPDGTDVERAANLVLRQHTASSNVISLIQNLNRMRPACTKRLLEAFLDKNPSREVQAESCLALATLLKEEASETGDESTSQEAKRLFERIVREYGTEQSGGTHFADVVQPQLRELNLLSIGRMAPEIDGEDLDGRKMKLSEFRGKVVLLTFWGTWCSACLQMLPEERALIKRWSGRPFVLLGVNADSDQAKAKRLVAEENMTWRSFRDGMDPGPIVKAWNVSSFPTTYLIDPAGVIRRKNLSAGALASAVEELMSEAVH